MPRIRTTWLLVIRSDHDDIDMKGAVDRWSRGIGPRRRDLIYSSVSRTKTTLRGCACPLPSILHVVIATTATAYAAVEAKLSGVEWRRRCGTHCLYAQAALWQSENCLIPNPSETASSLMDDLLPGKTWGSCGCEALLNPDPELPRVYASTSELGSCGWVILRVCFD